MTILPMLSQGDVITGKVPGVRLIATLWSNSQQRKAQIDLLVSMAIAPSANSLSRYVRETLGGDWSVVSVHRTQDAF